MYDHVCPFCESDRTDEMSYSENVKFGRKKVIVTGLRKLHCAACGSDFVPGHMHDENLALTRAVSETTRGAVSVAILRTFRETWSLSQKDASVIFGAGASSFGKWEAGQVQLSTPSSLLIQVAMKFPQVLPYLARLAGIKVSTECKGWSVYAHPSSFTIDVPAPKTQQRGRASAPIVTPQYGETYAVNDFSFELVA